MANMPIYSDGQHSNDVTEAQASFNDVFSLRSTTQSISWNTKIPIDDRQMTLSQSCMSLSQPLCSEPGGTSWRRKPKDAKAGLSSGLKSAAKGIVGGAVSLFAAPVVMAREEGAKGFFKGVGAGGFLKTHLLLTPLLAFCCCALVSAWCYARSVN